MKSQSARLMLAAVLTSAGHASVLIHVGQADGITDARQSVSQPASAMPFNLASTEVVESLPSLQQSAIYSKLVEPKPLLKVQPEKESQKKPKKNTENKKAPSTTLAQAKPASNEKRSHSVVAKQDVNFFQPPKFKSLPPAPIYPRQARLRGQQGITLIHAQLNSKGDVISMRVEKSSGFPLLDKAALNAIQGWDFIPGINADGDGHMWVEIPVKFVLNTSKVS